MAAVLRMKGDASQALELYDRGIRLQPQRSSLYYNRALVYANQHNLDQAIQDYTKALEVNPRHPDAHCNRGVMFLQKGELEKARADFITALQMNPNDTIARHYLATLEQSALVQAQLFRSCNDILGVLKTFALEHYQRNREVGVGIEKMDQYEKDTAGELSIRRAVEGAVLYLSRDPEVLIRITLDGTKCKVSLMRERLIKGYLRPIKGLSQEYAETMLANHDVVLKFLNDLFSQGRLPKP